MRLREVQQVAQGHSAGEREVRIHTQFCLLGNHQHPRPWRRPCGLGLTGSRDWDSPAHAGSRPLASCVLFALCCPGPSPRRPQVPPTEALPPQAWHQLGLGLCHRVMVPNCCVTLGKSLPSSGPQLPPVTRRQAYPPPRVADITRERAEPRAQHRQGAQGSWRMSGGGHAARCLRLLPAPLRHCRAVMPRS